MADAPDRRAEFGERIRERAERGGMRPRYAAGLIASIWLAAVIAFGIVEHLVDEDSFPTVWLGMWWALQTVTTVGYGDVVPASTEGRVVASLVLLGGLALLSVVTATITSAFVARAQRTIRTASDEELLAEIKELRAEVGRLSELVEDRR
ncbi:MAG: potassium channel family protein [Solirubrobacterales bacterium]|nr:two pore domain potassium channel family protein [Solirubrobacterales bacterium]